MAATPVSKADFPFMSAFHLAMRVSLLGPAEPRRFNEIRR
jgi:hypothetical protein